jgi:hypothetical protein
MNKMLLALAAGTAMVSAVPAAAQGYQNQTNTSQQRFDTRIDQLYDRLFDGIESGDITRSEVRQIRSPLRELVRLEARYSVNGLTRQERDDLNNRIRYLRQQIRLADGGGNGRYADYDDDDQIIGNNNNQNVRQVNQVCAQQQQQGGFGGLLAALLGGDNCLRVGERVTNNSLYAVPNELRRQFPDNRTHYFRYLDGNVIEIDARTSVVTRIFQVA